MSSFSLESQDCHLIPISLVFFLPSPLVSLAGAATSSIFVATKMSRDKHCSCRDKSLCLSRQKWVCFCRDKTWTDFCRAKSGTNICVTSTRSNSAVVTTYLWRGRSLLMALVLPLKWRGREIHSYQGLRLKSATAVGLKVMMSLRTRVISKVPPPPKLA